MKKINVVMLAAVFVLLNIFVVGCTYDKKRGFSFESPEDVVSAPLEVWLEEEPPIPPNICDGSNPSGRSPTLGICEGSKPSGSSPMFGI